MNLFRNINQGLFTGFAIDDKDFSIGFFNR